MGQRYGTIVLVAAGLFCLLTAWSAATGPQAFAERLGFKIDNAGGVNEVFAQYAGFFLAAAIVCAASLAGYLPRIAALVLLVAVFGGLFAGRVANLFVNGGMSGYGPMIRALYVIDSVGLIVSTTALLMNRSQA